MQAIQTKYLGPTNTRGSRIKAWCDAGSLTVDFHSIDASDDADRYEQVAAMLAEKLGWTGDRYGSLVTGCLPDGSYCHVFTQAVDLLRGVRKACREGRNNGNPWRQPELKAAFDYIDSRDGA